MNSSEGILQLIELRWSILPIRSSSKAPLTAHGVKDATADRNVVLEWIRKFPDCNWAVAAGKLGIIDLDPRNGGIDSFEDLREKAGWPIFETVQVRTGGGGTHYYFQATGPEIKSKVLAPGVELIGAGKYALIPPSVHPNSGKRYLWEIAPGDVEIMPLPEWLNPNSYKKEIVKRSEDLDNYDDFTQVVMALRVLAPHRRENYNEWLQVGMALSQLGEVGLTLWDSWSRDSDKYKPGDCARKWQTFKPDDGITLGSLYYWATVDRPERNRSIPLAPQNAKPSHYNKAILAANWEPRLNEANHNIEICGVPLSSPIEAVLRNELREYGYTNIPVINDCILALGFNNRFHPVREYLEDLHWDGEDNIKKLASYFQDKYGIFDIYLRRFLIGAVARICKLPPGQQNRMLVLDGRQNIGKSYFTRWLCSEIPSLYIEGPIKPDDKDMDIRLMSHWIWEVAELGSTFRRADRESLKFFISKEKVTVRKPYDRQDTIRPAMASFIGTVNNEAGFLSDPTGSRRFMATTITEIDWSYSQEIQVSQVWAYAYHLFRQGKSWHLSGDEALKVSKINEYYQVHNPIEDYIMRLFEIDDCQTEWFTPTTVIIDALKARGHISGTLTNMSRMIGAALRGKNCEESRRSISGQKLRGWTGIRIKPVSGPDRTTRYP